MSKFDSIRPYYDNEVNKTINHLIKDKTLLNILLKTKHFSILKYLPFSEFLLSKILSIKSKKINTIKDYQNLFESIVKNVINQSIDKIKVAGLENLKPNKAYLFISNHRDITLDSALLNYFLHVNGFETTFNAIGSNLTSKKWAADLMRLNKSFIIQRDGSSNKEIYKNLNLASDFICDSILEKNKSIWIAQKQGRAKDGIDETDPAVLKMIYMSQRKKYLLSDYFNKLNIVPVSVSYEKDPNDVLKAKELYEKTMDGIYVKDIDEDINSILKGIRGSKGNVSIVIGNTIDFQCDAVEDAAEIISTNIKKNYYIHATNVAAHQLHNNVISDNNFSKDEVKKGIEYLKSRMALLDTKAHQFLVQQYLNPLL